MTKEIDFSKFSSIKIGGLHVVHIIEDFDYDDSAYIIGGCTNTLLSLNPPKLSMLSKKFDFIELRDNTLHVGAATPNGKLNSFCKRNNIANFEFLSHLPGRVGGAIKMNAGLKEYEIFNLLTSIKTRNGVILKEDIDYGYRKTSIKDAVFEATFRVDYGYDTQKVEMFKKMRSNQPSTPSAGSCFKNPVGHSAGKLIDDVGLRGYRVGNMSFSEIHANFLVNCGGGVYEEAIELINLAQSRVLKEFGVKLELEIIVL
ncbi:MAG: UDP-N-acetylmuramate dehydrogenase [Campylobacterota bacterium]|nr:UDP-N-acetylmuramate dehydrogenase [Campylobacterota bacterium]